MELSILLYGRVSDRAQQGDNWSIPTQLEKMRNHCPEVARMLGAEQWNIIAELEENDSAFINGLERSELNKALDLARRGKINLMMFFSPDRFTRDIADGVVLRRELYKHGVRLFCFWPHFHEITSDMEVLNILTDWQSQQQVERQREMCIQAVRKKAMDGIFSQGSCPYGYRKQGQKKETVILICE